jgi:hypothetical protein
MQTTSPALLKAFAEIERLGARTSFGKAEAREIVETGFGHEAVRARFGNRFAALSGLTLDQAIDLAAYELAEDRAVRTRCGVGYTRVNPAKTRAVLLSLRMLRRFAPEFYHTAIERATTPWTVSLPEYRHGFPVERLQAAE